MVDIIETRNYGSSWIKEWNKVYRRGHHEIVLSGHVGCTALGWTFLNVASSYICYWLSIHITVRWKRMLLYSTMACGWSLKFSLPFCWLFRRKARFVGETGGRLRQKNGFEKDLIKKWNWRKLYWDEMVVLGVFILVSTSWKKEGGRP